MPVKSTGSMPSVSHIKKCIGQFKHKPRQGQLTALRKLSSHKSSLNVKLPTGYGKTYVALGAYSILSSAGIVNRNLIIVPTVAQLSQMKESSLTDYGMQGEIVDVGFYGTDAIEKHRDNRGHVFVATIQSLLGNSGNILKDMMSDGSKWMITVDEYHHYGIGKKFSSAVEALDYKFQLCLSATPMRPDEDLAFGKPDVRITYREAASADVVKELRGEAYYYVLDLVDEEGEISSVSIEDIANEAGSTSADAVEELIIKRKMRWSPKYISPLVSTPLARLMSTRLNSGRKAKAIIGAMCVSHAELIQKQVASSFPALSVDWVGTGDNGRPQKVNQRVVSEFRNGSLDVLVHVGIAGEGLDVPEITEVIHCNSAGLNVSNNQENGRGARACDGLPKCFISFDSSSEYATKGYVGRAIMDAMEFGPPVNDEEDKQKPDSETCDQLPDELYVIENIRLDRIDKGDPELLELTKNFAGNFADLNVEAVIADKSHQLWEMAESMLYEMRTRQAEQLTEESQIKCMQSDLKDAVNLLAHKIVKKTTTGTGVRFEKNMIGDVCKRIRTQLKKECGPVCKNVEKLKRHYAVLKTFEKKINEGVVPTCLR